ncbi:MAG: citrate synthase [Acidimicrobiales bacterium]
MLDTEEAARRLGVKVTTLYAYVSRGLLVSHPSPVGRRSQFDVDEVERLARRSRQGKSVETRMATITTGITQLSDEGPVYRGRRATEMATSMAYEEVAEWLWEVAASPETDDGSEGGGSEWSPLPLGMPPSVGWSDRMRWAVVMAGAHRPLRADLRPVAVVRTARQLAASMIEALPGPADGGRGTGPSVGPPAPGPLLGTGSMAHRLARRLGAAPDEALVRWVNAALVLLADHELATSTVAVRVAASTRADVCDAVLAGLGTLSGPLHGGASRLAYALLVEAERRGVERALDDTLRWQGALPGFGHPVYENGDARFGVLHGLFEQIASPERVDLVRSLIGVAAQHSIPLPNVDLALASVTWSTGMPPDAGSTLLAVARLAGWVAHYLEELEERPLRYRARAVYAFRHR